jgi:hypothetical protein
MGNYYTYPELVKQVSSPFLAMLYLLFHFSAKENQNYKLNIKLKSLVNNLVPIFNKRAMMALRSLTCI